jgi:hypothetical protein
MLAQCFNARLKFVLPGKLIITCSWHGATSARLWYARCSYPTVCHNILCPLFQECSFSCILLCHEFFCCGMAARCVAGIVTAWMDQQNSVSQALTASVLSDSSWSHIYCQCVICVYFPTQTLSWTIIQQASFLFNGYQHFFHC